MSLLYIDNYVIDTPIVDIIYDIKSILTNGKLKDIEVKTDDIKLTCPNDEHDNGQERNPDCHINLKENDSVPLGYFHCFACGIKGQFYHFVALCFSSTDEYAKKWLIKNYGTLAFETVQLDSFINVRQTAQTKTYLDKSILAGLQDWCPYLQSRNLSREACSKMQVKYDPKTRQVFFPVFDEHDNLLMIPRRSIDTKIFYMDATIEKPVYGLNIIKKENIKRAMLVEGPIDLLSCVTHGIPAIAILGTPSDAQITLINNSGLRSIYIATDNDPAGNKFANILNKKIKNNILKTRVNLPLGRKDVNDLTEDEWQDLIKKYCLN